jgi:hypothetical protein
MYLVVLLNWGRVGRTSWTYLTGVGYYVEIIPKKYNNNTNLYHVIMYLTDMCRLILV